MLIEFLSFVIMVPLAILAWRAIRGLLLNRNPNSRTAALITAAT